MYLVDDLDTTYSCSIDVSVSAPDILYSGGWNTFSVLSPLPKPINAFGLLWTYDGKRFKIPQIPLVPGKAYWLNLKSSEAIQIGSLAEDTDLDDIPDFWEHLWGFDYAFSTDAGDDPDGDSLINFIEFRIGSNPKSKDSDKDGLDDHAELMIHQTNPLFADTDGDSYTDLEEIESGTDPLVSEDIPLTTLVSSPANGETGVAITRETFLRFSQPLAESFTIDTSMIFAEFSGNTIPAVLHVSEDRKSVTLFYPSPLPANARIRVTIVGDSLIDDRGLVVDADGDGIPGGTAIIDFETLGLTLLENTRVCGRIFASELTPAVNGNEFVNRCLEGVTITVDGIEPETLSAITDNEGNFCLEPAPVGRFFVHIDGQTAIGPELDDGAYYPLVGKAWESVPEEEVNLGDIFLPLIPANTLQPVDTEKETIIAFSAEFVTANPQFNGVEIRVPPNTLIREENGVIVIGGNIGIAPVPPDRLPGPLPNGIEIKDVITIQTDGVNNFDTPIPICLPNLDNLAPGAKSALWSFNHDTGRFEVVGTMTVNDDGSLVCSDPGQGIIAPGWHGSNPNSPNGGGDGEPGDEDPDGKEPGSSEPPPADPNDDCDELFAGSSPGPTNPTDPIYLFSGEHYLPVQDLRIKGRGMDFIWARKYRSKIGPNTAQGNNWDFSYHLFLEQDGSVIEVCDGNSRRDRFHLRPGKNNTWGKREFFQELIKNEDGSLTMRFPGQGSWNYLSFDHPTAPGKIESIVDRNGNTIRFQYDDRGRLHTILDTLNRPITVQYTPQGFISSITDFANRSVTYEYYDGTDANGNFGDLKSVTSPTVTGTPNSNDFPHGKTTVYTYSSGFKDDRLNHNLLTITDPKGQRYLENIYAPTINPDDLNFDRVIRQIWGNPDDIIDLVYVPVEPGPENGEAIIKTILNDRVGNIKEYFYDIRSRCTRHREYTGRADPNQPTTETENRPTNRLRADDPEFFETKYQWNEDSLKTRTIYPNGNITELIYESDLNHQADVRARGNLRIRRRLPGSHVPAGDQFVIEEFFEYDTDFGNGCCGFNFVTRHVDARGNETLHTYDDHGNRLHTTNRIISVIDDYEYNQFGQITALVFPDNGSGHRRRDEYIYYDSGHQRGYVREEIIDVGETNFNLTTAYDYDLVGNIIQTVDPRGNDSQFIVNELDQIIRTITREVEEGDGIRYQRDVFYDANDNVIQMDIENIDDQGVLQDNTHFTIKYQYEILNYRIEKSAEVDPSHSIVTKYAYNANRKHTRTEFGEATNGNQPTNIVKTIYDERDLVFQRTRAADDPAQSTTRYDYDPNENIIRHSVGIEDTPRIFATIYDGYNRSVTSIDSMGNAMLTKYDANHNKVYKQTTGEIEDIIGASDNVRLIEVSAVYDAMDRLISNETAFFATETQSSIGDGTSIQVVEYSDNSQVLRTVNDNNHQTFTAYDTVNRVSVVTDHRGNTLTTTYDSNSNVISILETEISDLGTADEIFTSKSQYDGLDRPIQATDDVGNTSDYAYDSRNNRTVAIDTFGNMTRSTYDGINRLTTTTRFLTDSGICEYKNEENNGENSSQRRFFPNQPSNMIDTIVTRRIWDDTSRLIGQSDDNSNRTTTFYDALNRVIGERYADNTEHAYTLDVHNNKITMVDANGSISTCQYDLFNRLVQKDISPGDGVSSATTFETYKYDGLSRLIYAEDDDSIVTKSYNSLSNTTRETLNGQSTLSVYDGVGNLLSCTYPGGRVVTCTFDELERKKTVSDVNGMIATYHYVGPGRVTRREYGNGTQLDISYDGITGINNPENDFGVKRIIKTKHTKSDNNSIIDDRTFRWDWDKMYNKTQRADVRTDSPQLTHDYRYDSIYRLTNTTIHDVTDTIPLETHYDLDGVGNRTTITGNHNPGSYSLDNTVPNPADFQTNQYTITPTDTRKYDLNGNLTLVLKGEDASQSPSAILAYDYRNQMVSYQKTETTQVTTYKYDALGRRIEKSSESGTQSLVLYFYSGGWRVCEEQDQNNTTIATYIYGLYIDEILTMQRDTDSDETVENYYYHTDDLFNVVAITDTAGAVVERYDYDDYGTPSFFNPSNTSILASSIANPYLFTGRRYDPETKFYHYRTRYLEPDIGRFTTKDTIGIWGDPNNIGNGYTYVGNNPSSKVDPYGLIIGTINLFSRNLGPVGDLWSGSNETGRLRELSYGKAVVGFLSNTVGLLGSEGKNLTNQARNLRDLGINRHRINQIIRNGSHYGLREYTNREIGGLFNRARKLENSAKLFNNIGRFGLGLDILNGAIIVAQNYEKQQQAKNEFIEIDEMNRGAFFNRHQSLQDLMAQYRKMWQCGLIDRDEFDQKVDMLGNLLRQMQREFDQAIEDNSDYLRATTGLNAVESGIDALPDPSGGLWKKLNKGIGEWIGDQFQ